MTVQSRSHLELYVRSCQEKSRHIVLLVTALLGNVLQVFAQSASPPLIPSVPRSQDRQISWKLLAPNVLRDQKPICLFPKTVAEGKHLKPTFTFLSVAAGLIALDPTVSPYFRRTQAFNGFNTVFSGRNTSIGMAAFPFAFYVYGLARKNTPAQHTVLLAGEAVIDSEIMTTVFKDIDRRLRPDQLPSNGDFSDTWFRGHGQLLRGTGCFPSGHTIAAFSIATVFADRYPKPAWHRWIAFGLAGLVGFSRVTLQSHYPSDVFVGAVLGYSIAHYAVLRRP
jgi:membrane-associated phospholipid phosphatase